MTELDPAAAGPASGKSPEGDVSMLAEENRKLLRILYQMPTAILEIEPDGRMMLMNPAATRLLMPFTGGRLVENLFRDLAPRFDDLETRIATSDSRTGEIFREVPVTLGAIPGQPVERHLSCSLVRFDAATLLVILEDQTQRVIDERRVREAIEARALLEGKTEMASTVIHDIGNAISGMSTRVARHLRESEWRELTSISRLTSLGKTRQDDFAAVLGAFKAKALVDLLQSLELTLSQRQESWRDSIQFFANSMRHIEQIISIQRTYASHGSARIRNDLDPRQVVEDSISMIRPKLEQQGVLLDLRWSGDRLKIAGDPTKLQQVILNVLKNAFESVESLPTESEKRIRVTGSTDGSRGLSLVFEDNGSGFDPGIEEGLFEKGRTTKERGTGLGLGICRSILESHGGKIEIRSEGQGQGAVVSISLPAREVTQV